MKHIVIVEDEVFMREELNDMLCKAGYKLIWLILSKM